MCLITAFAVSISNGEVVLFIFGREIKMKKKFYSECSYVLGLFLLAIGTAVLEKADIGMSMVVAPAYLIYRKVSEVWSWFSFGMAEYMFQFILLAILALVMRKFRMTYFWSALTVVLYGLCLDGCMAVSSFFPSPHGWEKIPLLLVGMCLASGGIAFLLHTYILPEVYELFVKEIAAKYQYPFSRVKLVYDLSSLALSVVLSFVFFGFGHFEAIGIGTLVTALCNGGLIGFFSHCMENRLDYVDGLPLRKFFEGKKT